MIKVCKFGGTSLADGNNLRRVKEILERDPARKYVVVSAPGKRFSADPKVTDLLYETAQDIIEGTHVREAYSKVADRFRSIVRELGLGTDIDALLESTRKEMEQAASRDFCASRGEYLMGRIAADFLGIPYIEAREVIRFRADGKLDGEKSYARLRAALKGKPRAVIAGFYGEDEGGAVRTFTRGGSDVTGAVVARAVGADLYENWTDVSGFLACDPHIVPSPAKIRSLSYKELRELSYMGANVLHSEAIFPVREADIPICIKNTFRPEDEGTMILPTSRCRPDGAVTGIAGKKNFTVILLEKSLMNAEIGFTYRVLSVLARHKISFEHVPSGIDTMSLVIDDCELGEGMLETVKREIAEAVSPDKITVYGGIALLAVVGHGMNNAVGVSARLFSAIARVGVNVRMIDQGSSELNIIVGVDSADYERTVRAVYEEFFKKP